MEKWQFTFGALVVGFVAMRFTLRRRRKNMRSLATKLGFEYIGDGLPASFQMDCYPTSEIRQAWNVIEGTRKGLQVVIFDSIIGSGEGRYCSAIACRTTKSLFPLNCSGEKIAQCNGWTALYRRPFFPLNPGTISISRLEYLVGRI